MASRHRFLLEGREHTVVIDERDGRTMVTIDDGEPLEVDATTSGLPGTLSLMVGGRPADAYVSRRGQGFAVTVGGRQFLVEPAAAASRQRSAVGGLDDPPGTVTAPLAGVVVEVHVQVGDEIEVGQSLLVLEAMKMQNEIHAPHAGTVTAVHFAAGERAEQGELLVEYEPAESE